MHPVLIQIGSLLIPSYGAFAALGVLAALALAQFTSPRVGIDSRHVWNALALAVFSALVAERGLLIALNLANLRQHPDWLLALALVHHPLLSGVGASVAVLAVVGYVRWAHLPFRSFADALAAPVAIGLAFEQIGCLLVGSDFGRETVSGTWGAITYTSPLAARWSGTPLGIPLVPAQAYAALGAALVALLCGLWLHRRHRQPGEVAGLGFLSFGVVLFLSECLRDWEGRGVLHFARFGAVIDAPQLAAFALVLGGATLLADWRSDHA